MRAELNSNLVSAYPELLGANIEVGVGDGWYNIVDCALALLQHHCTQQTDAYERALVTSKSNERPLHKHECQALAAGPGKQPKAAQIKEKFGGLRLYVDGVDTYGAGVIAMAEQLSVLTCDQCGAPGERHGGAWIRTRCKKHKKD